MTDIRSQILASQMKRSSQMATIIGRYKGGMEVFSDELKYFAGSQRLSQEQKHRLCQIADNMNKIVAENEKLWKEMDSSSQNDIVELERVQSDTVELERA